MKIYEEIIPLRPNFFSRIKIILIIIFFSLQENW